MVAGHIMGASLVLVEMAGARTLLSASPVPPAKEGVEAPTASGSTGKSVASVSSDADAASVRTGVSALRFLFSGDLGHYDQPIVKDPAPPPDCDYLMCESTYGNRLHGEDSSEEQMARIINEAAKRNGPILIPAFAVGRTQEVL